MSELYTSGNYTSAAYAAGSGPWQGLRSGNARNSARATADSDLISLGFKRQRAGTSSSCMHTSNLEASDQRFAGLANAGFAGVASTHQNLYGPASGTCNFMRHSYTLDETIATTVASSLGPPSPLDWQPSSSQPEQPQQPSMPSLYKISASHSLSGPAMDPASSLARSSSMSQPFLPSGCQRPYSQQQQATVVAPDSSTGTMLYGRFRTNQETAADSHPSSSFASAATAADAHTQNRIAADRALKAHNQQQQLLLLQRQQAEAAAKARQQQQQLLLAQAAQQQQAALARSAAAATAAAAGSNGSRALYGAYRSSVPQQQWNSTATNFSAQAQQQQQIIGLHEQQGTGARLPPRPVALVHQQQQYHGSNAAYQQQQQQQLLAEQNSNISSSSRFAASSFASGGSAGQSFAAPAAAAAAGGTGALGRWAGPVGVIEGTLAAVGSTESDAGTGDFEGLECDEDLLSMENGDMYQQQAINSSRAAAAATAGGLIMSQQQQMQQRQLHMMYHSGDLRVLSDQQLAGYVEDSHSTSHSIDDSPSDDDDDMDEDEQSYITAITGGNAFGEAAKLDTSALVAARAAAVAAEQAAAARQSVVLQVLRRVASVRKGEPVLTATPANAAAAGAESVRSRLLITEVSVYQEVAANSQMALDQANKLLARMALPDDISFMPVSSDSFLFKAGAAWQFPAFVICLGSSYLQRMLARLPQLAEAALACPGFEDYCQYLPEQYRSTTQRQLSGPEATATLSTLRSVQFTCLFLATKVADQIHALGLLRFMLTNLSHNNAVVSLQQAADVEARCLDALDWRLGPFFIEDELSGDDEELWAGSMGHWDYGTKNDRYPETY